MQIAGALGYRLLRQFPAPTSWRSRLCVGTTTPTPSKLQDYFGPEVWDDLAGRTVVDFGCRTGADALEAARHGAERVIGIDIVPEALSVATAAAERAGFAHKCTFSTSTNWQADRILCIDAFEHFDDPAAILETMASMLTPGGVVLTSFGPPWYHPRGGHSFSVFPWAHLVFSEAALLRWRAQYRDDGARHFHEVEGGLNGMTIERFEKLVEQSPFKLTAFEAVPIRRLSWLHNRWTREYLTSIVRCKLVLPGGDDWQSGEVASKFNRMAASPTSR